jgi:hypothetical protein
MDIKLSEARLTHYRLEVAFVKPGGDVANDEDLLPIDGQHVVATSNPAVASWNSQDDTTKRHVVVYELHDAIGQAQLSGYADVDLGEGVRQVSWGPVEINIVPDEGTSAAVVSEGELIPKPGQEAKYHAHPELKQRAEAAPSRAPGARRRRGGEGGIDV